MHDILVFSAYIKNLFDINFILMVGGGDIDERNKNDIIYNSEAEKIGWNKNNKTEYHDKLIFLRVWNRLDNTSMSKLTNQKSHNCHV